MAFNVSTSCRQNIFALTSIAEDVSWCCVFVLVTLLLLNSFKENTHEDVVQGTTTRLLDRACDEIYVVGEGETLHSISNKCGDPFIVEQNPHIHDPDDVFPGLVIKITPAVKSIKFLKRYVA
ncbi:hypothetical protein PTKIN_Ptkin12aG0190600 [Pterospermum kingtungense]